MTNPCFIRVWWNHLWTSEAEKNLDVNVGHKFEEGNLLKSRVMWYKL